MAPDDQPTFTPFQTKMLDLLSKSAQLDPLRPVDVVIARLDRLLSSFLLACDSETLDEADRQTLKHHADDLIGVGTAALERLGFK